MKKRTKKVLGVSIMVFALGTGSVFALSALLNWTGADTVVKTKLFISTATEKILAQDRLITRLKSEKTELEEQLEDALKNSGSNGDSGNNQTVIELQNQIIQKNNEIAHLTQQLEMANSEVAEQRTVLDEAQAKLDEAGINMNWTE